jgi:hypothetical protein
VLRARPFSIQSLARSQFGLTCALRSLDLTPVSRALHARSILLQSSRASRFALTRSRSVSLRSHSGLTPVSLRSHSRFALTWSPSRFALARSHSSLSSRPLGISPISLLSHSGLTRASRSLGFSPVSVWSHSLFVLARTHSGLFYASRSLSLSPISFQSHSCFVFARSQ